MSAQSATASTITIRETLELLDGRFKSFSERVAEDRYVFWLGSGISFGRLDGLSQIIPRVVEFLRSRVDLNDDRCRYGAALDRVLELAAVSVEERATIDFSKRFDDWNLGNAIASRLITSYSKLLDMQVEGEPEDYLLWDAVDIPATFADPRKEPDVEHLCIAILVMEGAASKIVTANWDALLEKAADELASIQPAITVCVRPEDLRDATLRARLTKFHGCAVRATEDEETFRALLVGRESQISGWVDNNANAPLVNHLVSLAVEHPTLMVGLSAQDANIKQIFSRAQATMAWPWPSTYPSCVISCDSLGFDHDSLLRNVYRAHFNQESRAQILEGAIIRAYAKPLLIALFMAVLAIKLKRMIVLAVPAYPSHDIDKLGQGIVRLRDVVAEAASDDKLAFMHSFIRFTECAMTIFREGVVRQTGIRYIPLTSYPTQHIAGDAGLPSSGLLHMSVFLGLIGIGLHDGYWTVQPTNNDDGTIDGTLSIRSGDRTIQVFLTSSSQATLALEQTWSRKEGLDVVIVQSLALADRMQRSPIRAPGRTGRVEPRKVSVASLMDEAITTDQLLGLLRQEAAI